MNKRTFIPVLLVLSLIALGYAIYRSTAPRITTIENGRTVFYGDPQHGLTLGLCIFAGMCLLGIVALLLDRTDVRIGHTHGNEQTVVSKKIATNYPQ
jgi:hypothetical protein